MNTKHTQTTVGATQRGFGIVRFRDAGGNACSLQKSSAASDDYVWFGCDEIGLKRFEPYKGWTDVKLENDPPFGVLHAANTRMHLSRKQVEALLPHLQRFVKTGDLS